MACTNCIYDHQSSANTDNTPPAVVAPTGNVTKRLNKRHEVLSGDCSITAMVCDMCDGTSRTPYMNMVVVCMIITY